MIIKSFEQKKIDLYNQKMHLLYGENQGQINEFINNIFKKEYVDSTFQYEEKDILDDENLIHDALQTKSFFENKKLIIIHRATDKLKQIVETIKEKNFSDINIVFTSNILEKKSKLRALFEKDKKLICIPFYKDTDQTMVNLAMTMFKEKKINISRNLINIIIKRTLNNRMSLKNEIDKIESYYVTNKSISEEEILKITNLSENYDISTLIDNCLIKNKKKIIEIINDNNFSSDEVVQIIRTFLLKTKRLLKLKIEIEENSNIENALISYKPPIFWKDKEMVKNQLNIWTKEKLNKLIVEINSIELITKKNSENAINILLDFILKETTQSPNN
jgi:DNA polymerase-3 subunit delta